MRLDGADGVTESSDTSQDCRFRVWFCANDCLHARTSQNLSEDSDDHCAYLHAWHGRSQSLSSP